MGFKLNDKHSDDFDICVNTSSLSFIPAKRQSKIQVQGRDGEHVFEDGYDNIKLEFKCSIFGDYITRRKKSREIVSWLSQNGSLILDREPDIVYRVITAIHDVSLKPRGYELPVDDFDITFECEPIQHSNYYNDSVTWGDSETTWENLDIPWDGYPRTFTISNGSLISVYNKGTYKTIPIIKLNGVASSVTFGGFTITNLSGIVYVDCKNQLVYSVSGGNKVNKIGTFSGDFPSLQPGANQFTVTGTITNLTVEFDYKNAYL